MTRYYDSVPGSKNPTIPERREILEYYIRYRPLFLALIRSTELPFYGQYAVLSGKVLDFGCGDGFFLQALHRFYPQIFNKPVIVGVDIDKNKLKKARSLKLYTTKLIDSSSQKLPFSDGYFDVIISNCVLEHIKDLTKTLKELNRVLKKRGRVYLTVMTDHWEKYLMLSKKLWRQKQEHYHLHSVRQWEKIFNQSGFKVVTKYGYLGKQQSRIVERTHFISLPYLISYRLFNDWSKVGGLFQKLTPINFLVGVFSKPIKLSEAGGAFFELQK